MNSHSFGSGYYSPPADANNKTLIEKAEAEILDFIREFGLVMKELFVWDDLPILWEMLPIPSPKGEMKDAEFF